MSATNWSECPICNNKRIEDIDKLKKAYGVVDKETYEKMIKDLDDKTDDEFGGTPVREDYEIGLNDNGTLYIIYGGVCQNCGAEWSFDKRDIKRVWGGWIKMPFNCDICGEECSYESMVFRLRKTNQEVIICDKCRKKKKKRVWGVVNYEPTNRIRIQVKEKESS